jgi:hypothetical protein
MILYSIITILLFAIIALIFLTERRYKKLLIEYQDFVEQQSLPELEKLEIYRQNLQAQFKTPEAILQVWAALISNSFMELGIQNYYEIELELKAKGSEPFICTIQKLNGKTPHQLRVEAEEKVKELENQLKLFRSKL